MITSGRIPNSAANSSWISLNLEDSILCSVNVGVLSQRKQWQHIRYEIILFSAILNSICKGGLAVLSYYGGNLRSALSDLFSFVPQQSIK